MISTAPPGASAATVLLLSLLAGGCSGGPPLRPLPAASLTPWQIPQGAYGSQRLYRVSYSGPEGEGSFRVTLRLASPARYQLQAVDPIGRSLWSLDVSNDAGLWLNHRGRTYCSFEGRFDLSGVPLGPFPLLSLPSLLLGRVPADPAAGAAPSSPRERQFDFHDDSGRRWTGRLGAEGLVLSWTVLEGDTPKVWWIRRDDWAILSDREREVQVRWREVLRENLDREPPRLETPAGYREVPCNQQEVPEPDALEPSLPQVGEGRQLTAPSAVSSIRNTARAGVNPRRAAGGRIPRVLPGYSPEVLPVYNG